MTNVTIGQWQMNKGAENAERYRHILKTAGEDTDFLEKHQNISDMVGNCFGKHHKYYRPPDSAACIIM